MGTLLRDSMVKNVLKNLCCSYRWSYGVFWSFEHPNSLFLTMQDAYYEEKLEGLIENLRIQMPMLGLGITGQAAFTKKHKWMSIETPNTRQSSSNSICDMFVDYSEFDCQFSSGIKTIAAIPVEPQGVVQFGSTDNIMETEEFVYQTKRMFQETVNNGVRSSSSSSNCRPDDNFSCLISSQDGYFTVDDHISVGPTCSLSFPTQSSSFFGSNSQSNINSPLLFTNNHQDLFDSLPDLGIPDEILQTDNFEFDISQWIPPSPPTQNHNLLPQQELIIPVNAGKKGEILMPGVNDSTALGGRKGLFSQLGIEELLEGISGTSNATTQVSSVAKRRKTGNSIWEMGSLRTVLHNGVEGKKEMMLKSKEGLWMMNGYSVKCGSEAKKEMQPQKAIKKKAKPGTRPRPKDRQQILDRMAELRKLIPNGDKLSIDCLLDRTIKHMLFLESVTKHADRIKQAKRDNDPHSNGVTWACELENQTMVCPLIVEDLSTPGQMLIEMLCEENGFFLEMVDVIRGFGVTILKGMMEVREKIWARFIVETEAKRHVTRHEIFTALVQLLQVTCLNDNQVDNIGNALIDNYGQSLVKLPGIDYCIDL